ncbi:small glutamine-rich tetratricopeptide repeat-containing protein alpha-like [Acropora millepora]|uniref:small glutamine-rich tetratricopeptide repeat-containing protein alpha-like n=1 Tax=Acropora millepora TaxID=45264 RepID=UPI0010FC922F|nr:small glutamine-rich tetratricopeptide repeat-containing protein alpha-like [Acropora millepora]
MSNSQKLAFAIIEHLSSQLKSGAIVGDSAESLEVSIQCLESVYSINRSDPAQVQRLKSDKSLEEIFESAIQTRGGSTAAQPTEEDRAKAEELKNEGNQLMKSEKYQEAIQCYTKAMELDSANAVFPCNRAAAYSKMGNHQKAIEDCQKALSLDPDYGKAYGRMGLSYHSLNDLQKAKESYTKALELDPGSTFYQNSLSQVEEKIKGSQEQETRPAPGGFPGFGGLDLGSLLTNPAVMNMAQTFMSNPGVQQMMTNMMAGGGSSEMGGAAGIFQAAQQFGEQMQRSNPELFNELRGHAQSAVDEHLLEYGNQDEDPKTDDGDANPQ